MTLRIVASDHLTSKDGRNNSDVERVGVKASELLRIPSEWTPPFFVIPSFTRSITSTANAGLGIEDAAIQRLSSRIDRVLRLPAMARFDRVIVRSSANNESLDDRGLYLSKVVNADAAEIIGAIRDVREDALRVSTNVNQVRMAYLVQGFVDSKAVGHLSNERRVARKATTWMYEYELPDGFVAKPKRFRPKHGERPNSNRDLTCYSVTALEHSLRRLAPYFVEKNLRVHVEWIWDGNRLWIVQVDTESAASPTAEPYSVAPFEPVPVREPRYRVLRTAVDSQQPWRKVKWVRTFRDCGVPHGTVYILDDIEQLQLLSGRTRSDELWADLCELAMAPVVIRTDVAPERDALGFLLPMTGAERSAEGALHFLMKTMASWTAKGRQVGELCFLLHRAIPARAAAYAYAKPSQPRVQIDSTWGIPDGLSYFPHDSFIADIEERRVVTFHPRCKSSYIAEGVDGNWESHPCGMPWDWKASVGNEELIKIGTYARRVADFLMKPVAVMFFVDIDEIHGLPSTIAWYCSVDEVDGIRRPGSHTRFLGNRFTIRSDVDLVRLQEHCRANPTARPGSILLQPQAGLLRSTEFLDRVVQAAKSTGYSVELYGSFLQHVYYVLRREGIRVRCIDVLEETPRTRLFGKLVRDRIPLRIESRGEEPRTLRVSHDELFTLLKAKAVEEALELFWEKSADDAFGELADLLEVVESTCRVLGKTVEELRATADAKRQDRGGFEEGIVLTETRGVPLIEREKTGSTLLDDDEGPKTGRGMGRRRPMRDLIEKSRRPYFQGVDLVIPLVPPDDTAGRAFVLQSRDGDEIEVRFERSAIRVAKRVVSRPRDDSRQALFDFYAGES